MKSLEEAAKEYATKVQQIGVVREVNHEEASVSFATRQEIVFDDTACESFIAGAEFERKRSEILLEALEYCWKNGYLCGHDDPSWCQPKCRAVWKAKDAIKKYRESEGGG